MNNDEKNKLLTLLEYWIAHNEEHEEEFREWAEKAIALGETGVGEGIRKAADAMAAASSQLTEVKKKLVS